MATLNHGINTYKDDTNFSVVKTAAVGIPFFVGAWPCHKGEGYTGKPQIAYNFSEAEQYGGYSTEWRDGEKKPKWGLCQAMYSHFRLFGMSPAIFYNVYDPSKNKKSVTEESATAVNHFIKLSGDVIDNGLTVKSGVAELTRETDYEAYYEDDQFVIELLPDGEHYGDSEFTLSYDIADLSDISTATIEAAIEKVEECKGRFGIVPDLICCPGYSKSPSVAAVMAAKAPSINGLFRGKAVVDLDSSSSGARTYLDVLTWKNQHGYTDENMIVGWPLVTVGDYIFDASVIICGLIAQVDQGNASVPYESPSNKSLTITGCVNEDGEEVNLSPQQADMISYSAGVVTFINFDGWVLWGNYTGCWPSSSDVADYFICTNRMMDYICNTFVNSYWSYVDKPLTRVMIDAIVNSFNSWLNGLTHDNKLYGGEIQYVPENNPTANLIGGKLRLDCKVASPVPAQQIDMHAEYDVDMLTAALNI